MNFSFIFIVGIAIASGFTGFSSSENGSIQTSENDQVIRCDCTFLTKRIWVICSDSRFLADGKLLYIQTKNNLYSVAEEPRLMETSETWKGGAFFYFDISKGTECFRVDSVDALGTVTRHTDWVCSIEPSLVYEITSDVSANIRSRTTDVEDKRHPDAKILGLLLSSYISFDPSYENGYGAYPELETAWFSKYVGNYGPIEGPDLSNTYLFDYTKQEYENISVGSPKTRMVSVADKIKELSVAYSSLKHSPKLTDKRDKIIAVLVLFVCGAVTAVLIVLASKIDKKLGRKQGIK